MFLAWHVPVSATHSISVYDPPIETVVFAWGVDEDGQLATSGNDGGNVLVRLGPAVACQIQALAVLPPGRWCSVQFLRMLCQSAGLLSRVRPLHFSPALPGCMRSWPPAPSSPPDP